MASIEKRVRNDKVSYRARYRDPSGRQRVKTFRRKVDAEKNLALIEAAKLRGTWTDPAHGKITLAEWLETWWGSAADLRPSTVARDRAYLNSLVLLRFGTTPLAAITQPEVQAWAAHLGPVGPADAYVFTAKKGSLLRTSNFRIKVWLPAVRAAGLAPLRPHDLRHTAVALWIAAGANPKEVSARAGHTSVSFTLDRYGHLLPGHDDELRDRLDAMHAQGLRAAVQRRAIEPSAPVPRTSRTNQRQRS
jgi:integrase